MKTIEKGRYLCVFESIERGLVLLKVVYVSMVMDLHGVRELNFQNGEWLLAGKLKVLHRIMIPPIWTYVRSSGGVEHYSSTAEI